MLVCSRVSGLCIQELYIGAALWQTRVSVLSSFPRFQGAWRFAQAVQQLQVAACVLGLLPMQADFTRLAVLAPAFPPAY